MGVLLSRLPRPHRRDPDESGFTLIELVVALGVMTFCVSAITGVFWGGMRSAGVSSRRTDAVGIGTRETESMHAVPYPLVGFYGDQSGYTATYSGLATVTLASTTPAHVTPQISPRGTTTISGVTYTISRYI